MDWLTQYESDFAELHAISREVFDVSLFDNMDAFLADYREIYAALLDGSLEPGDLEAVAQRHWEKYKDQEIAVAKKEAVILLRLVPVLARLEKADQSE